MGEESATVRASYAGEQLQSIKPPPAFVAAPFRAASYDHRYATCTNLARTTPARKRHASFSRLNGLGIKSYAAVAFLFVGAPLAAPEVSEANERPIPIHQTMKLISRPTCPGVSSYLLRKLTHISTPPSDRPA